MALEQYPPEETRGLPGYDKKGVASDSRSEHRRSAGGASPAIRIFLMSDHPIAREGLRQVFKQQPGFVLVGCTSISLEELQAFKERADIVLLDIHSDNGRVLEAFPRIVTLAGDARVMVLVDPGKQEVCRRFAHFGAMGAVSRDQEVNTLVKAMRKVHAGEVWFDRALIAGLIRRMAQPQSSSETEAARKISTLTRREREVVQLLGQGLNPQALAERLCIAQTTVRHHLSSVLEKLEVRDRFDLVFYAYRYGLAVPPKSTNVES